MSILFLAALRQSAPLVLAAMGGVLSERAGVVNIALEGMMLTGAFAGIWAAQSAGVTAGLLAALAAGGILGLLHVLLTHRLAIDHILSGVALNILAISGTSYLFRIHFTRANPPRDAYVAHGIDGGWFILAAVIAPLLLHAVLNYTRIGLRIRAVGENPESARMAGLAPFRLRALGVTLCGVMAAAGGAALALTPNSRFEDNMVNGRGFIALAAVICGRWKPLGAALAAIVFGFFDSLQFRMQGNVRLPGELVRSLPWLATILAAALLRSTPPAALGKPLEEE